MDFMTMDNIFISQKTLNLKGKIIHLSSPLVMGIINLSSDSFYDGGRLSGTFQVLNHAENLLKQGAQILDIGAVSTRPGANLVGADYEIPKLKPVLEGLVRNFPEAILSVDTYNSQTVLMAANEGAHIINDVSGGQIDPNMFSTVARLHLPYVLTHMKGMPSTMQNNPEYEDVVREVSAFFADKIHQLNRIGINDIILDPGFGFGKTLEQNYQLLANLDYFKIFELPILVGLSRKSMINRLLDISPEKALNGTTALNTIALMQGASILRVHDVREAQEVVKITQMLKNSERSVKPIS